MFSSNLPTLLNALSDATCKPADRITTKVRDGVFRVEKIQGDALTVISEFPRQLAVRSENVDGRRVVVTSSTEGLRNRRSFPLLKRGMLRHIMTVREEIRQWDTSEPICVWLPNQGEVDILEDGKINTIGDTVFQELKAMCDDGYVLHFRYGGNTPTFRKTVGHTLQQECKELLQGGSDVRYRLSLLPFSNLNQRWNSLPN